MQKTVAVTGASGHIGNVVCRKLIELGYSVKSIRIQLFDLIGNLIFDHEIKNSNIIKLDLSALASSIYNYKLLIDDNKIFVGKVMKQ